MLPSFAIPLPLGTERAALLVEDVPACVFWQGYPEVGAELSDRDRRQQEAAWLHHLLVRVTIRPALDLEWVRAMGDDSWAPTQAYLEAVGFFPRPVLEPTDAAALREIPGRAPALGAQALRRREREHAAFRGCVPAPHVQAIFRLMAPIVGVPASALWLMPASEFFFNYHVQLDEPQKAAAPLPEVSRTP